MYFLTKHMTHDRGKMFPRKTLPSNKISPTNRPRGGGGWHPPLGQLLETQKGGAERVCLNTAGQFQANAHSKTAPTLEKRKVNGYNEPVVQRNVAVLSTTLLCTGLRGVGAPRGLPPLGVPAAGGQDFISPLRQFFGVFHFLHPLASPWPNAACHRSVLWLFVVCFGGSRNGREFLLLYASPPL